MFSGLRGREQTNYALWKPIAPKVTAVDDTTCMTAVSLQGAYQVLADPAKTFGVEVDVPHIAWYLAALGSSRARCRHGSDPWRR